MFKAIIVNNQIQYETEIILLVGDIGGNFEIIDYIQCKINK